MKTINKILIVAFILVGCMVSAQISVQTNPESTINNQNPFLDASKYNNFGANIGKGLYFPRTDLTTWEFNTNMISPGLFSSYFDGMVVYNTATGQTIADSSKGGIQVDVTPGFYYFNNPSASITTPGSSVSTGKWVRVSDEASSSSPWQIEGTTNPATSNTQNIYQMGNVGVGTNTPATPFQVAGKPSGANPLVTLQHKTKALTDATLTNYIAFTDKDNTKFASIGDYGGYKKITLEARQGYDLELVTDDDVLSTPKGQLFMSGTTANVGVGTVTPTAKFHIRGEATTTTPLATLQSEGVYTNDALTNYITFTDQNNAKFATLGDYGASKKVSLEANQGYDLELKTNDGSLSTPEGILFMSGTTGNVGIGTNTPNVTRVLHIKELNAGTGIGTGANIRLEGAEEQGIDFYQPSNTGWYLGSYGTNRAFHLNFDKTSSTTVNTITVLNDGKVGVKTTTPTATLDVDGTARIRDLGTTKGDYVVISDSDGNLGKMNTSYLSEWKDGSNTTGGITTNYIYANQAKTAGNEVVVTDKGNIGVGTTTPQDKLVISGKSTDLGLTKSLLSLKDESYAHTNGLMQTRLLFRDRNDVITGFLGDVSRSKRFSLGGKHGHGAELVTFGGEYNDSFKGALRLNPSGRVGIFDQATESYYSSTIHAEFTDVNAQLAVRTNNPRAIEIGNDRKINLNILNDGRIVYGYDDPTTAPGNHFINYHKNTANNTIGLHLSNDAEGGHSAADMLVYTANGAGRITVDNDFWLFLDSDNTSNDAAFVIYKDATYDTAGSGIVFQFNEDGNAYKAGGGSWSVLSDKRSKENIVNYTKGLKELLQVRPVNFTYKKEFAVTDKTYTGVIAQELEKVAPAMVSETERGNIKDFKTVDPNEFTYMLINSVKELKKQNDAQQKENNELKQRVEKLEALVKQLLKK